MVNKRVQTLLEQLRAQGIRDEHVLEALAQVPREKFVDEAFEHKAWENVALPIGQGQTISQRSCWSSRPTPACWRLAPARGTKPRSWRIWCITCAPLSELKVYSGRRGVA